MSTAAILLATCECPQYPVPKMIEVYHYDLDVLQNPVAPRLRFLGIRGGTVRSIE
jgi:hypothetical protein